jgi:hypothetical protein
MYDLMWCCAIVYPVDRNRPVVYNIQGPLRWSTLKDSEKDWAIPDMETDHV